MNEYKIEIYEYTHLHGGWVEYSADDDKYSDERRVDVVRKECITVTDLEFLHLPGLVEAFGLGRERHLLSMLYEMFPQLAPSTVAEKPSNAAELFREGLAWGFVYGPEIPAHQWDEMREAKVAQLVTRLHCPTTEK